VLLEKLTAPELVKKFPAFYGSLHSSQKAKKFKRYVKEKEIK
jgi:hypothetical protein